MAKLHYHVVAHDGGFAYKLGEVFSEPFPTRHAARAAAQRVAAEQRIPGEAALIEYEDEHGNWITETVQGNDRPDTTVD